MFATTLRNGTTSSECALRRGAALAALRGVTMSYCRGGSRSLVLDGVDLEIRAGECVFLVGPSGSGKTTLLSILGCVLTPDCGDVEIMGRKLAQLASHEVVQLRRDQIGFLFQRLHLIRGLTVRENVCVPLTLAGWRRPAAERRANELLEQVGLGDRATDIPQKLSVGQCQRVALARALAADPALVLADEPTASLDAESGGAAMGMLRRLTADAGKSLLVVTHDHRILPFADRVLTLDGGKLTQRDRLAVVATHDSAAALPQQQSAPAFCAMSF